MLDKIKNKKLLLYSIICIVIIVIFIFYFLYKQSNNIILLQTNQDLSDNIEIESTDEDIVSNDSQKNEIVVYIIGQVNKPGIVRLEEGARLFDALEKIGGVTQQADLESINLAIKLSDEQKIYIPKIGENETEDETPVNISNVPNNNVSNKININSASKSELETLPNIGDALAERIIEYRETHGSFKSIEEIKEVSRIGDKTFEEIKDKICI